MKCKDCYLAGPVGRFGQSRLCRLKGRFGMNRLQDCSEAITDSDLEPYRLRYYFEQKNRERQEAIRKCLEEKGSESSPVPPMWKATLSDLEKDRMRLENDILRIKLEREKLRLEKEQKIPPFEEFPWGVDPNNAKSAMGDWIAETLCYSVGSRVFTGDLYKSYIDFCDKHKARVFSATKFTRVIAKECNWIFDVDDIVLSRMCKGYVLANVGYRDGKKPLPSPVKTNHAKMQTFLCKNCGEYVLVPAEGIGEKVHWKCMVCYQENCFEVAQE